MAGLEELRAKHQEMSSALAEVRAELASATFVGQSDDERVTVTVDATGRFAGVDFDPRSFRSITDSKAVADSVGLAFERAHAAMVARRNELFRPILGPDYDAGVADDDDFASRAVQVGRHLFGPDGEGTSR